MSSIFSLSSLRVCNFIENAKNEREHVDIYIQRLGGRKSKFILVLIKLKRDG